MKLVDGQFPPLFRSHRLRVAWMLVLPLIASGFAPYPEKNPLVIPVDSSLEVSSEPGEPRSVDSAGGLIAADLENSGELGFLVTLPNFVGAYSQKGQQLWLHGDPIRVGNSLEREGGPGHHGAGIQAYDIDQNGRTEVLYLLTNGTLRIRDGATGDLLWETLPPPPGNREGVWEYPVVANLSGNHPGEIILQASHTPGYRRARYLAAFNLEELREMGSEAMPLWIREDYAGCAHTGVRVADLDRDGHDEIVGAQIIDGATGEDLYVLDNFPVVANAEKGWMTHLDAILIGDVRPERPGLEVVGLEEGGPNRVFLYDEKGLIWETDYKNWEPQNSALGAFRLGDESLQLWCRSRFNRGQRPFVFDANGDLAFAYELKDFAPEGWTERGIERIEAIHWNGSFQHAAGKERHCSGDVCLWDPLSGKFELHLKEQADRLYVADVLGDWREELVVLNGNEIRVYWNEEANPNPDRARLWESNAYLRSKQTYNYYSP